MAVFARGGAERPPRDKISQKSPCKLGLRGGGGVEHYFWLDKGVRQLFIPYTTTRYTTIALKQ